MNQTDLSIHYCFFWNVSSVISEETKVYNRVNFILNGPITISLVFLGIICNAISILTFLRPKRLLCIDYYLITLSAWDVALLVMASLLYSFPTLHYGYPPFYGPYIGTYRIWFTGSNICLIGSVWVVLILTVDRHFAVFRPLTHKAVVTPEGLRKLMILVTAMAVVFGLPRYFELAVRQCHDPQSGDLTLEIEPSKLRSNMLYVVAYKIVGSLIFYSALPFVLLLALTIDISIKIRASKRKQRVPTSSALILGQQTALSRADQSVNHMLLAVAVKFLISRLFPTALDVAEAIVGEENFVQSLSTNYAADISNLVVVLNSLTNSWIYFGFGKGFRRELAGLLTHASTTTSKASVDSSLTHGTCRYRTDVDHTDEGLRGRTYSLGEGVAKIHLLRREERIIPNRLHKFGSLGFLDVQRSYSPLLKVSTRNAMLVHVEVETRSSDTFL